MTRLVVLISGTGRNLQAIIEAIQAGQLHAEVCAVVCNNPDAPGLVRAEQAGIPTFIIDHHSHPSRDSFEAALQDKIDSCSPDLVVLAGFMRILGSGLVQHYKGRLINIHPSLLPKYRGLNTHARALENREHWHGASVHYVTEDVDGGPVILQGRVPVEPGDTPESLGERVMREVEVLIYPQVLAWVAEGRLGMRGNNAVLDDRILEQPMQRNSPSEENK